MMLRGLIQTISWVANLVRRFSGTGLQGQNITNRELYQHYAFSSNPPSGSTCVMIKNGNSIVSVAEDFPGGRPDLDALDGAGCLWMDATHYILIKKNGSVIVKTDRPVTIESDSVKLGGVLLAQKLTTEIFAAAVCTALSSLTGGTFPATPDLIPGGLTSKTEAE